MSDATNAVRVNNTIKGVLAIGALIFNAMLILWTTYYGQPGNSLHASAQSWGFLMGSGILFCLGIGSLTTNPLLSEWLKK